MHALALVAAGAIGVIAAAGAAGVGENEYPLVVVHESGGFGEIRRGGAGLDAEAVMAPDDAPGAAGDFGDEVRAEAVQDLIERALHRRQCREVLDHAVAAFDRLAGDDRIAGLVVSRTRENISVVVAVELEQLGRK
jgi:hypothetical protein